MVSVKKRGSRTEEAVLLYTTGCHGDVVLLSNRGILQEKLRGVLGARACLACHRYGGRSPLLLSFVPSYSTYEELYLPLLSLPAYPLAVPPRDNLRKTAR